VRVPEIQSYRFGQIVIDGTTHTKDVIILPDRVIGNWWRQEGHALYPGDLADIVDPSAPAGAPSGIRPQVLIVGQGAYGRMRVTPETRQVLQTAGIELIAQPTEEACQTYNHLREQRTVAAALHLTC
jgi:hypothetical protein